MVLFMLVLAFVARGDVFRLERVAQPCADFSPDVWAVMDMEPTDAGPVYEVYGDSLMSETVDGRRQWYAVRPDSILFLKEETALMWIAPERPVPVCFPGAVAAVEFPFRARGAYSQRCHLAEDGVMMSYPPRRGRLVTAPGDTLQVTMVAERRRFKTVISMDEEPFPLDAAGDSLPVYDMTRVRWYTSGDRLRPVAMQMDSRLLAPDGKETGAMSAAYIMSAPMRREMAEDTGTDEQSLSDAVSSALRGAAVGYSSGKIRIAVNGGETELRIAADITDEGGILYFHEEAFASAGGVTIEIPTASLVHGRYIVTLSSADTPAVEKRLVVVR